MSASSAISGGPASLDWDVSGESTDGSGYAHETTTSDRSWSTDLSDNENSGSFVRFLKTAFFIYLGFTVFVNLTWLVPKHEGTKYRVEVATLDIISEVLNLTEGFNPMFSNLADVIAPLPFQHRMTDLTGYKCPETRAGREDGEGDEACASRSEETCRAKREPAPEFCKEGLPLDPMMSLYRLKSVVEPLYRGVNIPCRMLLKPLQSRSPLSAEHHAYFTKVCSHADELHKTIDRDIQAVIGHFYPLWRQLKKRLQYMDEILEPPQYVLHNLGPPDTLGTGFNPPAYLNPASRRYRWKQSTDVVFGPGWFCSLRKYRWWPGAPCHFGEVLDRPSSPSKPALQLLYTLQNVAVYAPWLPYCSAHPSELPDTYRQPRPPPPPPRWNPLRKEDRKGGEDVFNDFVKDLTTLDDALGELIQLPRTIRDDGVLNATWWQPWGAYWDKREDTLFQYLERTDLLAEHASYLRTDVQVLLDAFSEALLSNRKLCARSEETLERLSKLISGRGWWSASMEMDGVASGKAQMVLEYAAIPSPNKSFAEVRETVARIANMEDRINTRWNEWSRVRSSEIQGGAWNMAYCDEMINSADIHWFFGCRVFLEKFRKHQESNGQW